MTDSTTTTAPTGDVGDPPTQTSPLLTDAAVPIINKFSDDLRALCRTANLAGMTGDMIFGCMFSTAWMFSDNMKDAVMAKCDPTADALATMEAAAQAQLDAVKQAEVAHNAQVTQPAPPAVSQPAPQPPSTN